MEINPPNPHIPTDQERAIQKQIMLDLQDQEIIFYKSKVAALVTQLAKVIHQNQGLANQANASKSDKDAPFDKT